MNADGDTIVQRGRRDHDDARRSVTAPGHHPHGDRRRRLGDPPGQREHHRHRIDARAPSPQLGCRGPLHQPGQRGTPGQPDGGRIEQLGRRRRHRGGLAPARTGTTLVSGRNISLVTTTASRRQERPAHHPYPPDDPPGGAERDGTIRVTPSTTSRSRSPTGTLYIDSACLPPTRSAPKPASRRHRVDQRRRLHDGRREHPRRARKDGQQRSQRRRRSVASGTTCTSPTSPARTVPKPVTRCRRTTSRVSCGACTTTTSA